MTHIKISLLVQLVKKLFSRNVDSFHPHHAPRSFHEGGVCPGLIEEMVKIQSEIVPLEEFERELAKQYKMVGNFDSVEVQAVAKRAAFYKDADPEEVPDELVKLDKLNELRRQLAELRSLPEKYHPKFEKDVFVGMPTVTYT
ncbi:hypothetical protein EV421DRAFT_1902794 [Armillaria borealis]|uniref:Uncharacterized protein n=1 Tax=Armillaria borealis TaxID=47425 RepID=A0AA39JM30_9AGAR|nr:hypothetical protein EV421DRAFT_1902794 [Armillaria borealis]